MEDLEVFYKGSSILSTSISGTKTLLTSGKYCEDDITITYQKPPQAKVIITSKPGALLTCGDQSYQLQGSQTDHTFYVNLGIYIVTATLNGKIAVDTLKIDIFGVYNVIIYPSALPAAYQDVGYIESTGTQYINTGIFPSSSMKMELDMQFVGSSGLRMSGMWQQNNKSFGVGLTNGNAQWRFDSGQANLFSVGQSGANDRHLFVIDVPNSIAKVGSTGYSISPATFSGVARTIYLCARNSDRIENVGGQILYGCKFYNNGELTYQFVPCYRKSDNKTGLYEIVNEVFYPNNGTDEFIIGV